MKFPKNWVPQSANCTLVPLEKKSEEFQSLKTRWKETMKRKIIKVERVQNKYLWERYDGL